ncbi:MAG: BLUF domain-containing protein [Gammaproteobacteria bacterium]|nr:BLUF domain-containing protein [Gammaproteobacteria bacterium]
MSQLYRLVYASKSTVDLQGSGVNLEIGRILTKSKRNNPKLNIGGVLYYGDGYFFQVLEGARDDIYALYEKIGKDTRHSELKVLTEGYIDQGLFGDWSMHFVPSKSQIRQLLAEHSFVRFTPFLFSQVLLQKLMVVLSQNGCYETQESKSNWWDRFKSKWKKQKAAV